MERKLLVLDLDETLVFASEEKLDRAPDFEIGGYHIYKRPYLDRFLEFCFERFRVGVWSQSSPDYACGVVERIMASHDRLEFVWGGDRCTFVTNPYMRQYYWVKDLKKLYRRGYRKEEIIFVDDTPRKLERSYGNLVRVHPFEGDPSDDELLVLMPYLEKLDAEENIRTVEKRGWRGRDSRPSEYLPDDF